MKYLYWVFGLVVIAGVGYASYQYGVGGFKPAENVVTDNTATDNTTASNTTTTPTNTYTPSPSINWPSFGDTTGTTTNTTTGTTGGTTNIGTKSVAITSPKNGAIIDATITPPAYVVTGTVTPNATKITVVAYGLQIFQGMDVTPDRKDQKLDEYTLTKFKLGDTTWSYAVAEKYGNLSVASLGSRFVVTAYFTDGTTKQASTEVSYTLESSAEMGKPVIYLYPATKQLVDVNVQPTSGISYSEPAIGNGWQVTANPDGTLVDNTGKSWPYLFWEGFAANFVTPKEGFVITRSEVSKFFDTKLTTLGLNAKEIADFKEFWVPRMQDKPYYFVTFIPQSTFDSYAPLTVSPKPDTVIRVFFDYKGLDKPVAVPTQILPKTPERIGFTVVEWGGRIYR